jgi:hypothetical protein
MRTLLCRLNLHHDWHQESTEDGARFKQCRRCGKISDRGDSGGSVATGAPLGM